METGEADSVSKVSSTNWPAKLELTVAGLKLEGAQISGTLRLNGGESSLLTTCHIVWYRFDALPALSSSVNLPVYLDRERKDVLFSVDVSTAGVPQAVVAQRGVCLIAA